MLYGVDRTLEFIVITGNVHESVQESRVGGVGEMSLQNKNHINFVLHT